MNTEYCEILKVKLAAFESDLLCLLNKHEVQLNLYMEGDTHGIYESGLVATFVVGTGKHWPIRENIKLTKEFGE